MALLKEHQIDLILKDIRRRGLQYEPLEEDILDYVCEGVERRMSEGMKFMDAYRKVLEEFGEVEHVETETMSVLNRLTMFRNFITIAFRNIKRNPSYSFINIIGLAVGLTACLLILLFIDHELSYDSFHLKRDRIFRLNNTLVMEGKDRPHAKSPFPVGEILRNDYPEIEEVASVFVFTGLFNNPLVRYEDKMFNEPRFFAADPSFFRIFDIEFIQGSPYNSLEEINEVVISRSMATKYFGQSTSLGETIIFQNAIPLKVTGVFEDLPPNSSIQFDFMISKETFRKYWMEAGGPDIYRAWSASISWIYVLLKEGVDPAGLETKFTSIVKEHYPEDRNIFFFHLQPLSDIHLFPVGGEIRTGGSYDNVVNIGVIALLILLASSFNYVNLTTARFSRRAREVGVRKSLGSGQPGLVLQFVTESAITIYLALAVAVLTTWLILPYFNELTGLEIIRLQMFGLEYILMLIGAGFVLGFTSGIYPAFILSNFDPVKTLSGKVPVSKGQVIRKGLAISQFVISIGLIFGIAVIHRQLDYMQNKDLGYDKELILSARSYGDIEDNFDVFKARVLENPNIKAACICDPVFSGWSSASLKVEGFEQDRLAAFRYVGEDFEKVFGLQIVEGQPFHASLPVAHTWSDSNTVYIINEAAVNAFAWEGKAIGKTIEYTGSNVLFSGKVIGVVEDFNFASLHEPIRPLVLRYRRFGPISVKMNAHDIPGTISYLEEIWSSLQPVWPFEYTFVDDKVEQQYQAELRLGRLLGHFTAIAVFISCLGFFGLASFTTENRLKELGIRKIMGASIRDMIILLEKEFIILSVLAFTMAVPLSFYFTEVWLDNFAYRISVGYEIPLLIFVVQLIIVISTVSFHVIKSSMANPVNILRMND